MLNVLYIYISTFRSMCAVPNMAVFCSSLISCFLGMLLRYFVIIIIIIIIIIGRDSVADIATRYRLDCPGIEFRWGRNFPCQPDRPRGQPSLLYKKYRVFFRG
jgi:hypothetical protein